MFMVSVGSKALLSHRRKTHSLVKDSVMGGENELYVKDKRKKGLSRKAKKENDGFDADNSNKNVSGRGALPARARKSWKDHSASEPQTSIVR